MKNFEQQEPRGLEYLVIPASAERWRAPRIQRAKEEINSGHIDKIAITGDINEEKRLLADFLRGSGEGGVYSEIRQLGFLPSQIRFFEGSDSEEDILYLGRFINSGDTVNFDTFPLHYREYLTIIKKAQRDGKFPRGVKTKNASIKQEKRDVIYGILGWMEEILKRRPLDYKKNRQNDYLDNIKRVIKRLIE